MNSFTMFHGGASLCPNPNNRPEKHRLVTFGKISRCLSVLLVFLSMSFVGFANSSTSLSIENNANTLSCDGKATDIWLVGNNGREKRINDGQQLCLSDIGFSHAFIRVGTRGSVGSMRIWVKGAVNKDNLENYKPYDSKSFDLKSGSYKITARIFSKSHGRGGTCSERTINFSIKSCNSAPCTSTVWFKNTGCKTIELFKHQDGKEQHVGSIKKDRQKDVRTFKGQRFTLKVNGNVIKNWTVTSCDNSTQNIDSGGCVTAPCTSTVWFKNTGCRTIEVFKRQDGKDRHVGSIKKGKQIDVRTFKGQRFTLKVNGDVIKNWTVTGCDNTTQNIDSKGCVTAPCTSTVWFKNTGCKTIELFKHQDGKEQHVGSIGKGKQKDVRTFKGQRFTLKVNGNVIKNWTVTSCDNSTQNIDSGGCNVAPVCDGRTTDIWLVGSNGKEVRINNGGQLCKDDLGFSHGFIRFGTKGHVGSMRIWIKGAVDLDNLENSAPYDSKSFDFRAGTYKISNKIFSERNGGGSGCSESSLNFTIKDCGNNGGNQPDCNDIKITTSRGQIKISGLKKAPVSHVQVFNAKTYHQVFSCAGNCKGTENINVAGGDYWLKVTYFTSSWKKICEVSKDVHVQGGYLTGATDAAAGRTATPTSTAQLATLSHTKTANTVSTTATDNTELATFGTVSSTLAPVQVYPNPANSTLFVNSSLTGQEGELVLFNQFGQTMKQIDLGALRNGTLQIDISNYQPGLYLMSTRLKSGEIFTEKVLIQ